jgi:hypothetical protein
MLLHRYFSPTRPPTYSKRANLQGLGELHVGCLWIGLNKSILISQAFPHLKGAARRVTRTPQTRGRSSDRLWLVRQGGSPRIVLTCLFERISRTRRWCGRLTVEDTRMTMSEDKGEQRRWMVEQWHQYGESFTVFAPDEQPEPDTWETELPDVSPSPAG